MKENLNMGGKYSIGVFGKNLIGVDIIGSWNMYTYPSLDDLLEDCIGLPLYMNAESNFTLSGTRVEFLLNGTM